MLDLLKNTSTFILTKHFQLETKRFVMLPRFHKLMLTILALTIAPKSYTAAVPNDERALVAAPEGWPQGITYIPGSKYRDHKALVIQRSPIAGLGLFVREDIPTGTILSQYTGQIIFPQAAPKTDPMNLYAIAAGSFNIFATNRSAGMVKRNGTKDHPRPVQEMVNALSNDNNEEIFGYYVKSPKELTPEQLSILIQEINTGRLKPQKNSPYYSPNPHGGRTSWEIAIDASSCGSAARTANVPSRGGLPNACFQSQADDPTAVYLVTTAPILRGEEITVSYGRKIDPVIQNGGVVPMELIARNSSNSGGNPFGNAAIVSGLMAESSARHKRNADEIQNYLDQQKRLRDEAARIVASQRAAIIDATLKDQAKKQAELEKKERGVRLGIFKAFAAGAFSGDKETDLVNTYKEFISSNE